MTVQELLHRMSARELTEWMAYYSLEPFGEERGDMRAGIVASTLFNINRGKKAKPTTPYDFMPKYGEPEAEDDEDEDNEERAAVVSQKLRAFFAAKNAQVKHHGDGLQDRGVRGTPKSTE